MKMLETAKPLKQTSVGLRNEPRPLCFDDGVGRSYCVDGGLYGIDISLPLLLPSERLQLHPQDTRNTTQTAQTNRQIAVLIAQYGFNGQAHA